MKVVDSHDRFSRYVKPLIQKIVYYRQSECRLMIMGCQRSGTTLLSKVFDDSIKCSVYGEFSKLSSSDPYGLRLNSESAVISALEKNKAPIVVMKPLVESQKAAYWLEKIPKSKIIWLFRRPDFVVLSSIKKFGPMTGAINKIKPIVDQKFAENPWTTWLTEELKGEDIELVKSYFSDSMNPNDAGLIFWYLRNIHFLRQRLYDNSNVCLLSYEGMTSEPKQAMEKLQHFIGVSQLNLKSDYINPERNQSNFECSSGLLAKCFNLYEQLTEYVV